MNILEVGLFFVLASNVSLCQSVARSGKKRKRYIGSHSGILW